MRYREDRRNSRRSGLVPCTVCGLVALTILCSGCRREARLLSDTLSFPPPTAQLGPFSIEWVGSNWQQATLRIVHPKSKLPVWESLPGRAFVTAALGRPRIRERRSMFWMEESRLEQCTDQTVRRITSSTAEWLLEGVLHCHKTTLPYSLSFRPADEGILQFALELKGAPYNRVGLQYGSDPEERIFGLGAQFTYFDLKGRLVPIVVSEQGIGRGAQPLTTILNLVAGAGGNAHTTYAPIPHYITSHLRSLALENSEYATFDFRDAHAVRVEVWAPTLRGYIYAGSSPLELISAHTRVAGRMRPLPSWIHRGAIVGMQGGTEAVRTVWHQLAQLDTPIAAFWLQDWVGQRKTAFGKQLWWNWELDGDRYPNWAELVAELRQHGIRVLTYINPFLVDVSEKPNHRRNLFREAKEAGFLVRKPDNGPYMILNTTFSAGLLDLTQPAARKWFLDVIRENVAGVGASGWMADFGEGLPFDAVLANGDAASLHNRYPELWAAVNREALHVSHLDDGVFFMRSGFTHSPGLSTLFWLGDQMVTWDRHDGIKSAVAGLLSSGLSGFAFNHSDIGGYTAIDRPLLRYHRTRELLLRWMELGAFQVVFRTHEGNIPEANHQFYSSPNTLRWFSYFARLFASWQSYREELIAEAAETGVPVVRHLFLHYPQDKRVWSITNEEFLVGPDLLVAPALDPGIEHVTVYLPEGSWVHLWSGTAYAGPQDIHVDAPIGQPAVFYRDRSDVGAQLQGFRHH